MHVPSQRNEIDFASFYDFGNVRTVWCFYLFSFLFTSYIYKTRVDLELYVAFTWKLKVNVGNYIKEKYAYELQKRIGKRASERAFFICFAKSVHTFHIYPTMYIYWVYLAMSFCFTEKRTIKRRSHYFQRFFFLVPLFCSLPFALHTIR